MQRTFFLHLWYLLLVLLGSIKIAQAQALVTGSVSDQAGKPIAFATTILLQLPDSTIIDSKSTDDKGNYTFNKVVPGRYCAKSLLIGYASARSEPFNLSAGQQLTVPNLRMQVNPTILKGVVVRGTPPALEQFADRTVINVDRLNTAGDNALDVLKKAPGIQLDKDEHIMYRGSTGVTVMIDGKLTYMSGEVLSSYLKSLPATAITHIELIPNPPSSMDAAGTAGVLNIRLRRSQLPGLSGTATVGAGYGRYEKASVSTNLSYNVGKVRLFTRLGAGRSNSFNRLVIVRNIRDSIFTQENYWHPLTHAINYATGAEIALTKSQTLGVQVRGSVVPVTAQVNSESTIIDENSQPAGRLTMDNPRTSHDNSNGINLNYRWILDSLGRELRTDIDYIHYTAKKNQTFTNIAYSPLSSIARDAGQLRSLESSDVAIKAAKIDYIHPFARTKWQAEAGAKTSWVTTRSAILFEELQSSVWQVDILRTNQFVYNENIMAAYGSLSTTVGKLELKGGLRGEYTQSSGESPTTKQTVNRSYFQLFPTLFANYTFSEHNQFGISGSRRITRPSYQNLNPFLNYTDAYTAFQGNPFLRPSLATSLVMNYTHRGFQILSLNYLRELDAMNEVIYQNDQTKVTTTIIQNLAQATTLSLTSGGHSVITKWWNTDNQVGVLYNEVLTQVEQQNVLLKRFSWTASSNHNFTLPHNYQLSVGGDYNSPSVSGLFYTKANGSFNIGLRKQLWDKKATLSLKISDLFYTNQFRSTLNYNNINMIWNNQYESRRVSLAFTCKIGNGKTQSSHNGGSGDEEGRIAH